MDYKREILHFEYFFFKPVGLSEVARYLEELISNADIQVATTNVYIGWMSGYQRKVQLFYQSQYRKHQNLSWLSFCQHYQVPDYESPANLSLDYEWTDWKENYQLNNHFEQYQMIVKELSELNNSSQNYHSDSETNNPIPDELAIYKAIDEIWFNGLINKPLDVVTKLRSMTYEKYLETSHWKKIRAAMILINTAMCQAEECSTVRESWYGGSESDLHIHHLDYSNRGNERFNDLAVLCKRHHELIHQGLNRS